MEHHESFFADPRSFVAIAFVIFFVLFGGKLWSALTALLDKRATDIRAELAEAQRLRSEAEAMLTDARARRESALADAKSLIEGARLEAARLAETARRDAEHTAARRERQALDRIAAAEKTAIDDVRIAAADIAATAAEHVIRTTMSAETSIALVDRGIGGLSAALAGRQAA